jgi:hypothetical protein
MLKDPNDADLEATTRAVARVCGWTDEYAETVQHEYQRFMVLCALPGAAGNLMPSEDVDRYWHVHMSDAADYATFSRSLGLEAEHKTHTTTDQADRWEATLKAYRQEYGQPSAVWARPAQCWVGSPDKE